jgi:broad specificity phosphatase PhoE
MKLYLARHAQTNYNVLKLANSDPTVDVHLSNEGIKQAENLRDLLKNVDFNIVYISQLPRTRQTAEIINQEHDKELVIDARLNDNKTGFESKPVADFMSAVESSGDPWNAKFGDGESMTEAAERARNFIDELKSLDYAEVLVVTHGFITQAIFGYLENKTLDEASQFNLVQGTYIEFEI